MYVYIKNRDTFIVMVGCGFKSDWTYPKTKRKKIKITYFNPLRSNFQHNSACNSNSTFNLVSISQTKGLNIREKTRCVHEKGYVLIDGR